MPESDPRPRGFIHCFTWNLVLLPLTVGLLLAGLRELSHLLGVSAWIGMPTGILLAVGPLLLSARINEAQAEATTGSGHSDKSRDRPEQPPPA